MIYGDDNIHEALEKVAAHQTGHRRSRLDLGSAVTGGLGAYGTAGAIQRLSKSRKLGALGILGGIGGGLAAAEGYRSLRSGSRRREIRRKGAESEEYMKAVRRVRRAMPKRQ